MAQGRVAHPLDFRFSRLVPKLWVPRPCVLCKGGYDDADSIEPFTVGSPAPALRNLREGQGTHIVVGPGSKGWATRPFNSSNTAPTNTDFGPVKVDWYTDIQASGGPSLALNFNNTNPGQAYTVPAYTAGKLYGREFDWLRVHP